MKTTVHPALSYHAERTDNYNENKRVILKASSIVIRNEGNVTATLNGILIKPSQVIELDAGQPIVRFENGTMHIIPLSMEVEGHLVFDSAEAAALGANANKWVQITLNSLKQ